MVVTESWSKECSKCTLWAPLFQIPCIWTVHQGSQLSQQGSKTHFLKGRVAEVAASATGIVDRVKQLEGGVEQSRSCDHHDYHHHHHDHRHHHHYQNFDTYDHQAAWRRGETEQVTNLIIVTITNPFCRHYWSQFRYWSNIDNNV